jgi:hypothetical protein
MASGLFSGADQPKMAVGSGVVLRPKDFPTMLRASARDIATDYRRRIKRDSRTEAGVLGHFGRSLGRVSSGP